MRVQRTLRVQFEKGNSREETLLGRNYFVVPVVAMVEGVRFGANQKEPELGLAAEFGDVPVAWANRPLVLNHPKIKVDGEEQFVSANSPDILERYAFGLTMNPVLSGKKLHMEAWIDIDRVAELGGEFQSTLDRIQAEEDVEVSVGFFSDIEKKKGRFNGQAYGAIWRNVKPDHLAVLEEGIIGACSVEDGCGIPRINTKEDINMASLKADKSTDTNPKTQCSCGGHTPEVDNAGGEGAEAEDAPVTQGGLKKAIEGLIKSFNRTPFEKAEEARQQTREENKAILAQSINTTLLDSDVRKIISQAGNKTFPKYSYLYGYNNEVAVFETWDDKSNAYRMFQIGVNVNGADVEFVGEPEEVILQTKVVKKDQVETMKINEENDMANETKKTDPKVQEGQITSTDISAEAVKTTPKVLTTQEYIDQAPAEIREALQEQMRTHAEKREGLIKALKDAKQNTFTDDELKAMNAQTLEKMVGLLPPSYAGVAPANQPRYQTKDNSFVEAPKAFVPQSQTTQTKTDAAA